MNPRNLKNKKFISIVFVTILIVAIFCTYQINMLKVAHSSFENYYKFRGCTKLIEKTDTYGTCMLSSGKTIKLVKVENKWFLDGDLGW